MNRDEIINHLTKGHRSFSTFIATLTDEQFLFSLLGKWTTGQQLQHIVLSVRPVLLALSLPKILVRVIFGKSAKSSRTYDELVKTYLNELENGATSSRPYIPGAVGPDQREVLIKSINEKVQSLCSRIESFTEKELDTLRLPHPVLGKLTMREMLFFTIYHVEHHHKAVVRSLNSVV